jgi:hypothetical protein
MRRDTLGARREPRRPVLRWKTAAGRTEECALSNARPVTIGRDEKSTIVLESRLVSKAHALVEFRDGEYTIQDLESANGTRVNGEATSVRVLEPGDRVEVGDVELTFLDLAADGPAAKGAPATGGSKVVRLAIVAVVTMGVMIGLLMFLISGMAPPEVRKAAVTQETLAPASPELLARLRAGAEASTVVKEVIQHATLAAVPPAQALYDEGRLRLENERWRETLATPPLPPRSSTPPPSSIGRPRERWRRPSSPITACGSRMPCCMPTRYCSWSSARIRVMAAPRK